MADTDTADHDRTEAPSTKRLEDARRFLVLLQPEQALADDGEHLHLERRCGIGSPLEPLLRLFEQLDRGERLALALKHRVGLAEHRGDEILDFLGARLLRARDARLPGGDAGADDQRQDDRGGGAHTELVAHDELARSGIINSTARERILHALSIVVEGKLGAHAFLLPVVTA